MSELYKKIDPKDVPQFGRGRIRGPLYNALAEMAVGDTITAPVGEQSSVPSIGTLLKRKFRTRRVDDVLYVQRFPDDAS